MKESIIRIGDSRGIRIPKVLLEDSKLGSKVELSVRNGSIVVSPIAKKKKTVIFNDEYMLSLGAFSDWNSPEEDAAWADLK